MSRAFDRSVCTKVRQIVEAFGYHRRNACSFVKETSDALGMIWFVEGRSHVAGHFMPRLSVGLRAVGDDVVVLGTDLHLLVAPDRFFWYAWGEEGTAPPNTATALEDLERVGLPWLDAHMDLSQLAVALEAKAGGSQQGDSNTLWFLSHCYESQGKCSAAIDAMRRYRSTFTLLDPSGDRAKSIEERQSVLKAKLAAQGMAHGTTSSGR
jgi:hypothetical protein